MERGKASSSESLGYFLFQRSPIPQIGRRDTPEIELQLRGPFKSRESRPSQRARY
jgi:hypothetical protein